MLNFPTIYIYIAYIFLNYSIIHSFLSFYIFISVTPPLFIKVHVPNKENKRFYCVKGCRFCHVLPCFLLNFGNVQTVWYLLFFILFELVIQLTFILESWLQPAYIPASIGRSWKKLAIAVNVGITLSWQCPFT